MGRRDGKDDVSVPRFTIRDRIGMCDRGIATRGMVARMYNDDLKGRQLVAAMEASCGELEVLQLSSNSPQLYPIRFVMLEAQRGGIEG